MVTAAIGPAGALTVCANRELAPRCLGKEPPGNIVGHLRVAANVARRAPVAPNERACAARLVSGGDLDRLVTHHELRAHDQQNHCGCSAEDEG